MNREDSPCKKTRITLLDVGSFYGEVVEHQGSSGPVWFTVRQESPFEGVNIYAPCYRFEFVYDGWLYHAVCMGQSPGSLLLLPVSAMYRSAAQSEQAGA